MDKAHSFSNRPIVTLILQVALKPNTLMPFGSGVKACPSNEFAKLETGDPDYDLSFDHQV